ncbi:GH1 family beta-glucosidase [Actinosynnema sp. NPDC047251]|uniref:Beta-glucosidase n=1 Tax=Saccharothrix espanaensis (strain ATCC 51144 / DSM 44229 / JCM 9112 / NBRC 15066 / NRRL 15764) TaxID=1179773 RepID=K0JWV1_SACES|nr:GH1 family beta-glucosidase [Saccharothrix espanaensis]CCH29902.1 Thermostable beta-glucosidase B [Saccharothrix espanaensis DSM 44229]
MEFPKGFLWGAATAAFQVEGATAVDGRTKSIWDEFCEVPGAVVGGHTGEPAADHYRRVDEDVRLMAGLGLQAYRFSVAWPRVRPDGGRVNQAGLDFYSRLVDRLLEAGIQPWPTLYHWDLPQALEERGGWAGRATSYRFADFAESVAGALGDRVENWTTVNEPWCSAFLGYAAGVHAPGRREPEAAVAAVHHLLLGHGLATEVIRGTSAGAKVGITLNLYPIIAADPESPADVDAVRRLDGLQNRIFLEPLLLGRYPEDVVADLEPHGFAGHLQDGDLEIVSAPLGQLGVNYYAEHFVSGAAGPAVPGSPWVGAEHVTFPSRGLPRTDMGWEVEPAGLTKVLVRVNRDYPSIPLYVTENGAAYRDVVAADGEVYDPERLRYLESHLRAAHAAIEAGVDLRGYFAWSLMDNFEWAEGYAKRFGIVHVDYDTQVRTPKMSAMWYSQVARGNALAAVAAS